MDRGRLVKANSGITVDSFVDEMDALKEEMNALREEMDELRAGINNNNNGSFSCASIAIRVLIFVRLLPKDKEDWNRIKIGLRVAQWMALIPDVGAATYSIASFSGISHCCGKPLLNFGGDGGINWCDVFKQMTRAYLLLVVLEIYPVVRAGLPFNLINPPIGFFLTVVLFFDDGKETALAMLLIEAFSVLFEFFVLRLKVMQRAQRLMELDFLAKAVSRKKHQHDETQEQYDSYIKDAAIAYENLEKSADKEDKLIKLMRSGIILNSVLILASLALIIAIAKAGGLCISSELSLNILAQDQYGRCDRCQGGEDELCEICTEEYEQCYFPYQ